MPQDSPMPSITIDNTTVTVSARDSYLLDYDWIIEDGVVLLADVARPDHVPGLRRKSMLGNIMDELGIRSVCLHDGNPFNLCRSNLLPLDVRPKGKRFVVQVAGRVVVSATTYSEALKGRREYYDEC
jgi:hypothetical protein